MKHKLFLVFLLLFGLLALTACNPDAAAEISAAAEPTAAVANDDAAAEPTAAAAQDAAVSAAPCAEAEADTHELVYAAQGICFLYPENYDVYQGEDGSLALYVRSLLNTEAPMAIIRFDVLAARTIQEVVPDYPSEAELATMSLLTIDLGQEKATVLDNLPGQDVNRRIIAVHDDRVIDIMIARVGEAYGEVGQQAETLYKTITSSFQFIGIEPAAPLLAGPECPESPSGTTLFTNEADGYCLLLPDGYDVDDTLASNNGGSETAVYVGSLMDTSHARLFITVDDANGRSLEEITSAKEAEIAGILGTPATWSFGYMLDGVFANQFDQVPGQDFSRQVIMVRNGRLYTLTFIPDDAAAGDPYIEMQALYDSVMGSFSFLRQS